MTLLVIIVFIYISEVAAFSLKDYKDINGDKNAGMNTLPVRFGVASPIITCIGLATPSILIWVLYVILKPPLIFVVIYFAISIARLVLASMILSGLDQHKSEQIVKYFRFILLAEMFAWCLF
jgi:4-hydroxybenzoate polyprenyltransferase